MRHRFLLAVSVILLASPAVLGQVKPVNRLPVPGAKIEPAPGKAGARATGACPCCAQPAPPPPPAASEGDATTRALTGGKRSYVAGKFGLELDGVMAGWLFSAEGGDYSSEVVSEKMGTDHIVKKHIAGIRYRPITVTCGTGMSRGFYEWIKATFDKKDLRKNGAIIFADYNYKEEERLTFANAIITEITFPALDAASKDAAKMTVTFTPEFTRSVKASGAAVGGKYAIDQKVQKKWLPANFRFKIDGLEDSTNRVNKIEAITFRVKVAENTVGEKRDAEKEPARMEVPDLVFTFPESNADKMRAWMDDFVLKGNCGDDKEKNGTLEYLTPNLQEVLFTLTFKHLGIYKLVPEKVESGSESIGRMQAFLYSEDAAFEYKAAWAALTPPSDGQVQVAEGPND